MLAHLPGVDAGKVTFGTHQLPAFLMSCLYLVLLHMPGDAGKGAFRTHHFLDWEYTMIDHRVYSQPVIRGGLVPAFLALLHFPSGYPACL